MRNYFLLVMMLVGGWSSAAENNVTLPPIAIDPVMNYLLFFKKGALYESKF